MTIFTGDVVIVHSPTTANFEGFYRPCFDTTDKAVDNIRIFPYDTDYVLNEGESVIIDEIVCIERKPVYTKQGKFPFINTYMCAKISPYRAWEHLDEVENIEHNSFKEITPTEIINGYEIGV